MVHNCYSVFQVRWGQRYLGQNWMFCGYFLFLEFRGTAYHIFYWKWMISFSVQWFVAREMGHYFARCRLGKFSSSLLDYKILLKGHRSLRNESSFLDSFLLRNLRFLQNPLWAFKIQMAKYMAIWKAFGQGLPWYVTAPNSVWSFYSPSHWY